MGSGEGEEDWSFDSSGAIYPSGCSSFAPHHRAALSSRVYSACKFRLYGLLSSCSWPFFPCCVSLFCAAVLITPPPLFVVCSQYSRHPTYLLTARHWFSREHKPVCRNLPMMNISMHHSEVLWRIFPPVSEIFFPKQSPIYC